MKTIKYIFGSLIVSIFFMAAPATLFAAEYFADTPAEDASRISELIGDESRIMPATIGVATAAAQPESGVCESWTYYDPYPGPRKWIKSHTLSFWGYDLSEAWEYKDAPPGAIPTSLKYTMKRTINETAIGITTNTKTEEIISISSSGFSGPVLLDPIIGEALEEGARYTGYYFDETTTKSGACVSNSSHVTRAKQYADSGSLSFEKNTSDYSDNIAGFHRNLTETWTYNGGKETQYTKSVNEGDRYGSLVSSFIRNTNGDNKEEVLNELMKNSYEGRAFEQQIKSRCAFYKDQEMNVDYNSVGKLAIDGGVRQYNTKRTVGRYAVSASGVNYGQAEDIFYEASTFDIKGTTSTAVYYNRQNEKNFTTTAGDRLSNVWTETKSQVKDDLFDTTHKSFFHYDKGGTKYGYSIMYWLIPEGINEPGEFYADICINYRWGSIRYMDGTLRVKDPYTGQEFTYDNYTGDPLQWIMDCFRQGGSPIPPEPGQRSSSSSSSSELAANTLSNAVTQDPDLIAKMSIEEAALKQDDGATFVGTLIGPEGYKKEDNAL